MNSPTTTSEKSIGGHILRKFDLNAVGKHTFAHEPYFYFHQILPAQSTLEVKQNSMITAYVLKAGAQAKFNSSKGDQVLRANQVMQIEGVAGHFQAGDQPLEIFIAGVNAAAPAPVIKAATEKEIKFVEKPWGYEMWLNGEHPAYAFKKIYLKAGNRTSLQYHRIKRETNLIYQGSARLHYKSSEGVDNDKVRDTDIAQIPLSASEVVDVFPLGLHRIEAMSDIFLFEVSTPHLDDVVRVSDDTLRPDGRIAQEHSKK